MQKTALALGELRDVLAVAQHEISILERITKTLTSIVALSDGAGADPLISRQLGEIDRRMAVALDRQKSLADALEECRRDLRSQGSVGLKSVNEHARRPN